MGLSPLFSQVRVTMSNRLCWEIVDKPNAHSRWARSSFEKEAVQIERDVRESRACALREAAGGRPEFVERDSAPISLPTLWRDAARDRSIRVETRADILLDLSEAGDPQLAPLIMEIFAEREPGLERALIAASEQVKLPPESPFRRPLAAALGRVWRDAVAHDRTDDVSVWGAVRRHASLLSPPEAEVLLPALAADGPSGLQQVAVYAVEQLATRAMSPLPESVRNAVRTVTHRALTRVNARDGELAEWEAVLMNGLAALAALDDPGGVALAREFAGRADAIFRSQVRARIDSVCERRRARGEDAGPRALEMADALKL